MDHMPQQTKIYCTGSSVDELLKRLRAESRHAERLTITKEEFASHFEDSYQKEMKWRMDRGGPSPLEIMRVANTMGESLDTERLQNATQTIDETWMKEKGKPWKKKSVLYEFALPGAFQQPETFRRRMEQQSAPIPRLSVPALPVYLVFIIVLAYWCYYGYQYNETHYPLSITAIIVFFLVVIVLVLIMMTFREYHRRVRMCPLLKRMADRRPGAFLVIEGSSPSLFYAREKWIGKVNFKEGGESETASTRLDAVTEYSMGSLEIVRTSLLGKVFWSEKGTLPLPESDFSRKFKVSAPDPPVAGKLLNPAISDAVLQLDKFDRPFVEINGNALSIQVDEDLSRPRKETELSEFLEEAEGIVEATVRQAAQSANRR